MFKLIQQDFIKQRVTVHVPQDLGRTVKNSFVVHFKLLDRARIEGISDDLQSGAVRESELLGELVVGFEEVQDEHGQEMVYSDEARDTLLNINYVHLAVMNAFIDHIGGGKQNHRKN